MFGDRLPTGSIARLGTIRFRHGGPIRSVAISADAKTVATGGDSLVCLWEASTGKRIQQFAGHEGQIGKILFSPDGKFLVSFGYDATVRCWELASGKEINRWSNISASAAAIAISPNGKAIVVGAEATIAEFLDCKTNRKLGSLGPATCSTTCLAYSPDGTILFTGHENGTIQLWDTQTNKRLQLLKAHAGSVVSAAYSARGNQLASIGQDGSARVWDVATGKKQCEFKGHEGELYSVSFAADAGQLVTASDDGMVTIWACDTKRVLSRFRVAEPLQRLPLAYSPCGKMLITGHRENMAKLWNISTGKEIIPLPAHCGRITSIVAPPGSNQTITGGADGAVCVWETKTGKQLNRLSIGKGPVSVIDYGLAGNVFILLNDSVLSIRDMKTGEEIRHFGKPSTTSAAIVSPNRKLVAACGNDGAIRLYNIESGDEIRRFEIWERKAVEKVHGVTFSGDGKIIAALIESRSRNFLVKGKKSNVNTIYVWNTIDGTKLTRFPDEQNPVSVQLACIALTANGQLIASSLRDGRKRFWDVQSGKERYDIEDSPHRTELIVYSPSGRLLAVAGQGKEIRIIESATGNRVRDLTGHGSAISSLLFAGDDRTLISGSEDTTCLVWDLTAGITRPPGPVGPSDLDHLWSQLATADAAAAFDAGVKLAAMPAESTPYISKRLRELLAVDAKSISVLIAALESERFESRQKARRELEEFGDLVEVFLQEAQNGRLSAEARKAVTELLERKQGPTRSKRVVHVLRAVGVLEQIGTAECRKTLERLGQTVESNLLKQEIVASIQRLVAAQSK
jgi:WD40 repeat protein